MFVKQNDSEKSMFVKQQDRINRLL